MADTVKSSSKPAVHAMAVVNPDGTNVLAGASTEAKQDVGNTSLASIDTKLSSVTTPSDTQPISATTLPLPSGAATEATLTSLNGKFQTDTQGNTKINVRDVYNNEWQGTNAAYSDANTTLITAFATAAYNLVYNGTEWDRARGDITNGLDVDVTRSALPTGAATSALQTTGNTSLASIDAGKDPLAKYKIADTDDDASPNYFGFTDIDGNWYILKETVSAGANTYRYAAGTSSYATNWTNRASLSYDYLFNVL